MAARRYRRLGAAALTVAVAFAAAWSLARCSEDLTPINGEDTGAHAGKACKNNAQCGTNEVCAEGYCVPNGAGQDGAITTCKSKVECRPGQDCVGGHCTDVGSDAGGDGLEETDGSLPNGDGARCTSSSSCTAGWRCSTDTHTCEKAGIIRVDPSTLDFGAVPYGTEVTRTLTVSNAGAADLRVLGVDFDSGTNPDPNTPIFRKTPSTNLPAVLHPAEVLTVDVILRQTDAEPDKGALLITSTDQDSPLTRVPMASGYKGSPDLAIIDRTATPPKVLYPKSGDTDVYTIDLGNVALGGTKEVSATITNMTQGDAILALKDVQTHKKSLNDFTVAFRDTLDTSKQRTPPIFVGPGDMVDLVVDYAPSQKADADETDLDVTTNDDNVSNDPSGGGNILYVKLLAKAGWLPGGLSLTKGQILFGEVQINTSASDTVTACNDGGSPLSIAATSGLQFPNTAFATQPQILAKTLNPTECFDITVTFSPAKTGDATNNLVIDSDDPGNPHAVVSLAGTGTDPTISVFPNAINYPMAFVGVAQNPVNVVVKNTGAGSLQVTAIDLTAGSSQDFKVTNKPPQFPVTLHGNQADSISFTVEFTPSVNGAITGAVEVTNTDNDNPRIHVDLSATAEYATGHPCTIDAECPTTHCVDGVCCNLRCDGLCERCDVAGSVGTCAAVPAGTDPDNECATEVPSTCGKTGQCSGTRGSCELYPPTTVCTPQSCNNGLQTNAMYCNGSGTCTTPNPATTNCAPYVCNGTAGCYTSCLNGSECMGLYACSPAGECRKGPGVACLVNAECWSGFCVDGVCCAEACGGLCEACTAAKKGSGTDGTCGAVAANTDPDNECGVDLPETCGKTGQCSGSRGSCQIYASGTVCAAQMCANGVQVNTKTCSVAGVCTAPAPATVDCTPYVCNGTSACYASCITGIECATGYACASDHTCRKAKGQTCGDNAECASGFCADDVCCNEACGGVCDACTAAKKGAGTDGTCGAVAAGTDPDNDCPTDSASTCQRTGNCPGSRGTCELYASGTVCQPQTCTVDLNSSNNARVCDGAGGCQAAGQQNCSPFKCNGATGLCRTSCTGDGDCQTGYTCSGGICGKAQGQPCTNGMECASHNCADGTCCNEACTGLCEACTAAKKGSGTDGTCGAVAANTDPDNECATDPASTCQKTGQCSGNRGSCQLYGSGTVCAAQTCAAGVQTNAKTCDGLGTCTAPSPATVNCTPYVCNGAACYASCTTGAECASGFACAADHTCKKSNGQTCASGGECATGFCADGVCCNEACGGLCEACVASKKGAGADGACGAVAAGTDPDNECATDAQSTCQKTGFCSGTRGSCQLYSSGVVCQAQTCAGNTQTNAKTCNGSGTCTTPSPATTDCSPYNCAATACKTSCSGDGDCITNYSCAGGVCKKSKGQACGAGTECASGFCTDGVCCESACGGVCEKCNQAGRLGFCDPVPVDSDPDLECPDDGAASCKRNGNCSGSRTCKLYTNGTVCVAASCTVDQNSSNTPDTCDGAGNCVDTGVHNCSPYKCNTGTGLCKTSCTVAGDCQTGYSCSGGVCMSAGGTPCTLPSQCASNFCVDGYCCDTACGGVCEKCNIAGSLGVCAPVPAGTDPDNECATDPVSTCQKTGNCSGSRSCALYGSGTVCNAAYCSGNTSYLADTCNGTGTCVDGGTQACVGYICDAGTGLCKTSCSGGGDCQSGYICSSNQCKKDKGQNCTAGTECASGFCTDGVCCESACAGVCEKCNQAGRLGFCDAVPVDTDPDNECSADAQSTCQKTGNCSGSRTCKLYPAGTVCNAAYCSGNTSYKADTCNGTGTCVDNGTQACPPYVCDAGTGLCKTSCNSSADCVSGYACNTGTHVCLKDVGQACTVNGDCITNACCSNVCRDLQNDVNNCGACAAACSSNNISRACITGSCESGTCNAGYADCDLNKRGNGCEINTTNDPTHCGGCSTNCNNLTWPHVTGYTCSSSQCALTSCAADWYNFDAVTNSDGCECGDASTSNKACGTAVDMGAGNTCTDVLWNTCYDTCYDTCYQTCCYYYFDTYYWDCEYWGLGHVCDATDIAYGCDSYGGTYQCNPYQCNPHNCNPHNCNPYLGNPHTCDGVDDDGRSATVTGNIPKTGDAKWYKVDALNNHWDRTNIGSLGTKNPFNFRIGFTSNPNDDYQLEVFTDCVGNYAGCPDVGSPIHSTTSTDMWEFNAAGEDPCVQPTPLNGKKLCVNHAQWLYVKITRRTAANCTSYTLKVVNNTAF